VLVGAAAPFAWRWYTELRDTESTDNATLQGNVTQISSRINGTVVKVAVEDNQRASAGQVLVELDPTDYEIALAQAKAALALAQRQSETAKTGVGYSAAQSGAATTQAQGTLLLANTAIAVATAGVETAQSRLLAAQAKLAQAQAQARQAERDLERTRQLAAAGVIPGQRLDQAETACTVAAAAVDSARQDVAVQQASLEQARLGVDSARAQLKQSQGVMLGAKASAQQTAVQQRQYDAALAQIQVATQAVAAAQQQLAYTSITAPTAGRAGSRSVETGQRVVPAQPLLALVQDGVWVVANFKETQVDRIRPGMPVDVRVDTLRGKVFHGHVDSLSPASGAVFALLPPENASGNFTKVVQRIPVKIVFEPGDISDYGDMLRPGMSVIVRVKVR
jgi:membrane fusion protein (multidrug efflux system)